MSRVVLQIGETSVSLYGASEIDFKGRIITVPPGQTMNFPIWPASYNPPLSEAKGKEVFEIKAVKTIGGWVGQVHHNAEVVWESSRLRGDYDKASADARKHLNNKIKELFA